MWRTLAGGLALALMAMRAPVVNAASAARPAAEQGEKKVRSEDSARATKAPRHAMAGGTSANGADQSNEKTQPSGLDGEPMSGEIADLAEADGSAGQQPARNLPEMLNRTEMLSLVRKYTAEIAESLVEGEKHREVAVREKDSIKLACIQDRLSNMKLVKRMADQRLVSTELPTVRRDELSLLHEFRGVEMAHKRVVELRRELKECAGESLQVSGPTGGIPSIVDPSASSAEIPRVERPTPASVFN